MALKYEAVSAIGISRDEDGYFVAITTDAGQPLPDLPSSVDGIRVVIKTVHSRPKLQTQGSNHPFNRLRSVLHARPRSERQL